MKLVIIGNSAAAVGCIEGFRKFDHESDIVLISKEPHHVYGRPLISYLLQGKTDMARMKWRGEDFNEKNRVKPLLGKTAVKIDASEKTVALDDGVIIQYDKLLYATGSRPFVPPVEGLDRVKNRHFFMTLDDALSLEKSVDENSKVMILGAGLIGLKCAEALAGKVKAIDVIDMADRVLPSVLDETGSVLVQNAAEDAGVNFHLGTSAARFGDAWVELTNGRALSFDALVVAVGVRPNVELLKEAGTAVNRGIVIDACGRTSLPDVFAAGDCTECRDLASGTSRILALLPNAYLKGESAGRTMAGKESPFEQAIPLNAGGFFGLHIATAGSYDGECHVVKSQGGYKRLITKDSVLKGFILAGDVSRSGIYTAMIRNRTPLNEVDFELLKERPQLMAYSKKDRQRMLGGAV
jgi:NAD(P)H-nitrite reductase large subunit